ncbi:MAG: hypothetical protein LBQ20_07405 [Rhodanobacter sp.]|jgi:hypothetical protein|nr:hypothetical protein [Rhodanobacter sp.]
MNQADRVALERLPEEIRAAGDNHSIAKARAKVWRIAQEQPLGTSFFPCFLATASFFAISVKSEVIRA